MNEYLKEREREEALWESLYDLHSVKGIEAIPDKPVIRPGSHSSMPPVTAQLEYYLTHLAGCYEKSKNWDLAEACYKKAFYMLPFSIIRYDRNMYMRYPRFLFKIRKFEEGRAAKAIVEKRFPSSTGGEYLMPKQEFISRMLDVGHSESHAEELYKLQLDRIEQAKLNLKIEEDWEWAWEHLPEYAPRSGATYMSWRNSNNQKYQELKKEALKMGRSLL